MIGYVIDLENLLFGHDDHDVIFTPVLFETFRCELKRRKIFNKKLFFSHSNPFHSHWNQYYKSHHILNGETRFLYLTLIIRECGLLMMVSLITN